MRKLILWITLSISLCLCPGPTYWYGLMNGLSNADDGVWHLLTLKLQVLLIFIEENREIKQLFAHFILMTVCAYFLVMKYRFA